MTRRVTGIGRFYLHSSSSMSAFRIANDLSLHLLFRMYSRSSCAARAPISFSLRSGAPREQRDVSAEQQQSNKTTGRWLFVE